MEKQFVHADGKILRDINGEEFAMKGVGLGGWMLPEGYMWGSYKYYERPRRFEERITELVGETEAAIFWDKYYKSFISDKDFELISNHGFNSIRLPINFRMIMVENELTDDVVFLESGFKMIDYVVEQCKKHNQYLILDLHGAPGGQTGANIDDSKYDKPELFTKRIYQVQTIKIWEELARRYKDETIIAAYDLLNEPLPKHNEKLYDKLIPLYKEIIQAIRKIDTHHMISIEGVNWSTDFSVLNERLDDNVIIHFHKYWNSPTVETIKEFLDKRDQLNHPLYMGEGGENDCYWYAAAFKLYDQLNISWNFWTYKKIENTNSIISFKKPDNWLTLFKKDEEISKEKAIRMLNEFLKNIKFENCVVNKKVTNHLFRKDEFMIPSAFYDNYGEGISFQTNGTKESSIRKNDKTSIVNKDGNEYEQHFSRLNKEQIEAEKYPYLHMYKNDFYNYTFDQNSVDESKIIITHNDVDFKVYINDNPQTLDKKDGYSVIKFVGTKGSNVLRIECIKQGIIRQIKLVKR